MPKHTEKSTRIALIIQLWQQGRTISSDDLVELTGVGLRSAERDLKTAKRIMFEIENLLFTFNHPAAKEKLYNVDEAADILKLNAYHVRLLARKLNIGKKIKREWRFTSDELKMLKKRPHAWNKRKARKAYA